MATTPRRERPARTLTVLGVIVLALIGGLLAGVRWSDASLLPNLALDLEGGTQIILTPVSENEEQVTEDTIAQAIEIIRQRVDASGVAEAEITSQGGGNIVVGLPGRPSEETLDLVRESARMLFRPVIAVSAPAPAQDPAVEPTEPADEPGDGATTEPTPEPTDEPASEPTEGAEGDVTGAPLQEIDTSSVELASATVGAGRTATQDEAPATTEEPATDEPATEEPAVEAPEPTDASDPAWVTEEVLEEFSSRDCTDPANLTGGPSLVGDPDTAVVACHTDGSAKYILGPVELAGEDVASASSGLRIGPNGTVTNVRVVNIDFDNQGTAKFREVTTRLLNLEPPRNQFAMVLDGLVISAPSVNNVINDGNAEISGSFDQESAATLARQLNFGSLPLTFEVLSEAEISATLGTEQLQRGILAGLIGLVLVGIYSLIQYRVLGFVTIGSLVLAALVTYLAIAFLSWTQGYRLSLPGVAGLIVAIGITADSFIVYFERIRDELRDGRTLPAAVEEGWRRARRTILASDAVSFLAAVVLYFLAVGGVRGFAFTLGLTTLIDVIVVFMFTHPLMVLLARTGFFGRGHRWSGLAPEQLGTPARYLGRGRVSAPRSTPSKEPALVAAGVADDAPAAPGPARERVADPGGRSGRMTIAERRAAASQGGSGEPAPGTSDPTVEPRDDRKDG